ncbi:hypothetical protein HY385_00545 [Candidatus Daviesbacteria bacterium]|nr:hypothetical protein [Candidatus Daviesbacteria bacterium]
MTPKKDEILLKKKVLPKVVASGYLENFDNIPCYNLDNGQRVFRLSDMTVALRGKLHGKFANYLATENIKKYIPERLWPDVENDRLAQGITLADNNGQVISTYDATDFIDICIAFIKAEENKEKLSIPQQEIVERATAFILATAKVGITGLIDEATGYQYIRPSDELAMKMAFFLSEELRPWEKTFPDQFWKELGRLTNWTSLKQRPRYWGRLVNEFIYEALDADIAKYLQENKPPRVTGKRYHQWLQEDRGIKALMEHIWTVIGLAKTCESIDDLRFEIGKHFSKDYFQDRLFSRREIGQMNVVGDKKKFNKAIDKAIKTDEPN